MDFSLKPKVGDILLNMGAGEQLSEIPGVSGGGDHTGDRTSSFCEEGIGFGCDLCKKEK